MLSPRAHAARRRVTIVVPRVRRGRASALVAFGLPLIALITLSSLVSAGATAPVDAALLQSTRGTPGPLTELLRLLSHAGDVGIIAALSAALAIALATTNHVWTGVQTVASVGSAALGNLLLKVLVDRMRPDALLALLVEEGASYPSGHATLSATLYGLAALLIARTAWPRWLRASTITGLVLVVVLIGTARVYLGVHYPTDIIAGWLLGITIISAARVVQVRRLLVGARPDVR